MKKNQSSSLKTVHLGLLSSLPGNFLVLDAQQNVRFVSEGYQQLTRLDEDHLLGEHLQNIARNGRLPGFNNYAEAVLATVSQSFTTLAECSAIVHNTDHFETLVDPDIFYWQITSTPILEGGEVMYITHTIADLTGMHTAEKQLESLEERCKLLEVSDTVMIWDWDLKHQSVWRNKAYYRVLGLDKKIELINPRLWYEIVHPDDKEVVLNSVNNAIKAESPVWYYEYRLRTSNGSFIQILDQANILYTENGEAYRMLGVSIDVTAQRNAEQKVKLQVSQFEKLIQAIPNIAWLCDPAGNPIFINDEFLRITGKSQKDTLDLNWLHLIHPEDRNATLNSWKHSLDTGTPWNNSARLLVKDRDEYTWFFTKAVPLKDAQGTITGWVGTGTDIDQQKKAAKVLEEQRNKFRQMLDALPIMAWAATANGESTFYNKQWYAYFNTSSEEWTNAQWAELMHPDDREHTIKAWYHSLATGETYNLKTRWQPRANAPYRWFAVQALPVRDENGAIDFWMGTTVDIQGFEDARQRLEEKFSFLQNLIDALPFIAFATTPEMQTLYFNKRCTDVFGITTRKEMDMLWQQVLHPDDYDRTFVQMEKHYREGTAGNIEYRLKTRHSNSYRWFYGHCEPLKDTDNRVEVMIIALMDVHDQKLLLDSFSSTQRELHDANQELEEKNSLLLNINKDLDTFVYAASHDLKSPVNNLDGLIKVLKMSAKEVEQVEIIRMMEKSVGRLRNTIADLTEVIKFQNDDEKAQEAIDIREVIAEIQDDLKELIESTATKMQLNLKKERIIFSRKYLRSIFYNLLSNAIKYRSPQRNPIITITTGVDGAFIKIQVADNGLGIHKEDFEKVFGMFKRIHTHIEGTGVGMYLVKKIVDNTGGRIELYSEVEKGSVFDIYLPA